MISSFDFLAQLYHDTFQFVLIEYGFVERKSNIRPWKILEKYENTSRVIYISILK